MGLPARNLEFEAQVKSSITALHPVEAPSEWVAAPFSRRAAAWLMDFALLSVMGSALSATVTAIFDIRPPAQGIILLPVNILASILYFSILESSTWQASIGKLWVGLKVQGAEGGRLGVGRALGRYMVKFICMLPFGAGGLAVAFHADRLSWHDRISATRVVEKRHEL